ncbi:hypothetical protein BKK52_11450 [Rodentibacter trehalosifermentans]|uniref:Uncharacterized protein n=1 Tax=Rodentibacter trehalosifermentans TaxID=1908263 RepID=A0A1V3IWF5_9PAST|nr:hypothetical protein [Rodentibacter trehalosifermentans]OOF46535.1 hypothetical protein BKK52_11450 [Rodentibacter trehalosifermentans]
MTVLTTKQYAEALIYSFEKKVRMKSQAFKGYEWTEILSYTKAYQTFVKLNSHQKLLFVVLAYLKPTPQSDFVIEQLSKREILFI